MCDMRITRQTRVEWFQVVEWVEWFQEGASSSTVSKEAEFNAGYWHTQEYMEWGTSFLVQLSTLRVGFLTVLGLPFVAVYTWPGGRETEKTCILLMDELNLENKLNLELIATSPAFYQTCEATKLTVFAHQFAYMDHHIFSTNQCRNIRQTRRFVGKAITKSIYLLRSTLVFITVHHPTIILTKSLSFHQSSITRAK